MSRNRFVTDGMAPTVAEHVMITHHSQTLSFGAGRDITGGAVDGWRDEAAQTTSQKAVYYAHSPREPGQAEGHLLRDHLIGTAEIAAACARAFGAEPLGFLAGLWHDLGKYSEAFQRRLELAPGQHHEAEISGIVDHSTAGAQHAVATLPPALGHLLAYGIAGHHGGLPDTVAEGSCLETRLRKDVEPWQHGLAELPETEHVSAPEVLQRLWMALVSHEERAFAVAFFVRMVFSCLVDADFLDTEAFVDPARAGQRPRWPVDALEQMQSALDAFVARFGPARNTVDQAREDVRAACLRAASQRPGFFSLTVPTGGGKTLSSLAFALRHAVTHGLRRVVYVIPFTSIVEQNAAVFRQVFEPLVGHDFTAPPVVEHHSALDADRETQVNRLASENWDAPLVVTTSVQFYESLFANRPSRCRKLHNLARTVVVLDEVQKLPVDYLKPCLWALRELVDRYGTTVVLCTATQPAIGRRTDFPIGLTDVREIVPDPHALYAKLRRVDVSFIGRIDDTALAEELRGERQVLCIVNTRAHARKLCIEMGEDDACLHLSAAMCPAHRSEVLAQVRRRLSEGEPCRVVSTQLVEAGVDLDFPVVYRAMAGLDSVAQAAGRCNRNGRLARGRTVVFRSTHDNAERFLADTTNATAQIVGGQGQAPLYDDLLSPDAIEHYFRLYFWQQTDRWDRHDISGCFELIINRTNLPYLFQFRSAASRFRLIDDHGTGVVVPWGAEGRDLVERLEEAGEASDWRLRRRLQRYTVQVPKSGFERHLGGAIRLMAGSVPVLASPEVHYHERFGLWLDRDTFDAEDFIV